MHNNCSTCRCACLHNSAEVGSRSQRRTERRTDGRGAEPTDRGSLSEPRWGRFGAVHSSKGSCSSAVSASPLPLPFRLRGGPLCAERVSKLPSVPPPRLFDVPQTERERGADRQADRQFQVLDTVSVVFYPIPSSIPFIKLTFPSFFSVPLFSPSQKKSSPHYPTRPLLDWLPVLYVFVFFPFPSHFVLLAKRLKVWIIIVSSLSVTLPGTPNPHLALNGGSLTTVPGITPLD